MRSILDPAIRYPEIKGIDPDDDDYDAPIYEIELFNYVINVAVGKAKYAFVDKSVVYYPIYLVNGNNVITQLGLYEVLEEALPNIVDADGDPDLKKMSKPLIYDYVDDVLLQQNQGKVFDEGEEKGKEEGKVQETDNEDVKQKISKRGAEFDDNKSEFWIQRFMKNNSYEIKDNEGGGDCFFSAIRDGLSTIGKTVTVVELRNRISNAATPELYEQYRVIYKQIEEEVKQVDERIKEMTERAKVLKTEVANATNRNEKAKLLLEATALRDSLKAARDERSTSKDNLAEFKWISKLTTFPKFVKALRTCSFWADEWATSVMERLYNIKVILFSEESYDEGDINNVIQCGRADDELIEKGIFRPTDYIMMVYTGNHYKLITYSGKGAFTFNELPRDVVELVKQKCMERNAGLYSIIPEFVQGLDVIEEDVEEPENLQLHGEGTVFQFYDQAAVKPAPGKGTGEIISEPSAYKDLKGDWRRKLSHGFDKEIKLDGHIWKTVEHYVQAQRFAKEHPEFYVQFALDSGSDLSKDVDMARAAGAGKKYDGKIIKPKNVEVDADWNEEMESKALEKALIEKFKDIEMAAILRATRDAKLMLYRKGKPARVEVEMMRVRNRI